MSSGWLTHVSSPAHPKAFLCFQVSRSRSWTHLWIPNLFSAKAWFPYTSSLNLLARWGEGRREELIFCSDRKHISMYQIFSNLWFAAWSSFSRICISEASLGSGSSGSISWLWVLLSWPLGPLLWWGSGGVPTSQGILCCDFSEQRKQHENSRCQMWLQGRGDPWGSLFRCWLVSELLSLAAASQGHTSALPHCECSNGIQWV